MAGLGNGVTGWLMANPMMAMILLIVIVVGALVFGIFALIAAAFMVLFLPAILVIIGTFVIVGAFAGKIPNINPMITVGFGVACYVMAVVLYMIHL